MNPYISKSLACQIVNTVSDLCGQNVNFIDCSGIIFASTNEERIGDFHEIGRQAAVSGDVYKRQISYCSPTVVPPPVHSSPTVRYHLHSECTVRPVCETPSRIHSDTHLLRVGIDSLPAGSLLLSLFQHRFPSLRLSDIALPSV